MADEPGVLTQDQLEALNLFLNDRAGEEGLLCPVTGAAVPIASWNAPAGILVLPGPQGAAGYEALPLTSPAGGVLLISMLKLRAWQDEQAAKPNANSDRNPDQPG